MTSKKDSARAFWICAAVTAISAIVSASFSVAALLAPDQPDVNAMYAASRSIALPLVVLVVAYFRSRDGLAVIAEPGRRSDREGAVAEWGSRESLGAPSLRPPPGGGPAAGAPAWR